MNCCNKCIASLGKGQKSQQECEKGSQGRRLFWRRDGPSTKDHRDCCQETFKLKEVDCIFSQIFISMCGQGQAKVRVVLLCHELHCERCSSTWSTDGDVKKGLLTNFRDWLLHNCILYGKRWSYIVVLSIVDEFNDDWQAARDRAADVVIFCRHRRVAHSFARSS